MKNPIHLILVGITIFLITLFVNAAAHTPVFNVHYPTVADRDSSWDRSQFHTLWEVSWNGGAHPAYFNTPYHLWWDNPHDDDYDDDPSQGGNCRFRFNDPSGGFMTVDRIKSPTGELCKARPGSALTGRNYTGAINRRDEYLDGVGSSGLTIELRVQITDHGLSVQNDAFQTYFIGPNGNVSMFLSPDCIKLGQVRRMPQSLRGCGGNNGAYSAVSYAATNMTTYRIVISSIPSGGSVAPVSVYVNGSSTPIISSTTSTIPFVTTYEPGVTPAVGDTQYEFPTIIVGDISVSTAAAVAADEDYSTAYTLDYINYSRGTFPPGTPIQLPSDNSGPLRTRVAPPLPSSIALTGADQGIEFDAGTLLSDSIGNDANGPIIPLATGNLNSVHSITPNGHLLIPQGNGSVRYNSLPDGNGGHILGNDHWTLEMRAKLFSDSDSEAFALNIWDHIGSTTMILSPNDVRMALGNKILGKTYALNMDTTDDFHIYRMVRKKNDPYVYLYIDNNPIPAIADFKMSNVQRNGPIKRPQDIRLWYGYLAHLLQTNWSPTNGNPINPKRYSIEIDYIRWSDQDVTP